MSIKVESHIPSSAIVPDLASSSKHVLDARMVEIPANVNGTYSYSTNSRIEFNIASPSDFMDFLNSYIRMDVTTDLTYEAVDAVNRYWAEGGAHAMFRSVSIETAGGVLIQKIDRYNKWVNIMSHATQSPDYVDSHLSREGDSVDMERVGRGLSANRPASGSAFAFDFTGGAAAQLITGTASNFYAELQVGDICTFLDLNLISAVGVCTSVLSTLTATFDGLSGADATYQSMYITRPDEGVDPARKRLANTDNSVVCFQLLAPFMQMQEWFPLFLLRGGLKIVLDLERPEYVIASPNAVISTGFTAANIQLSNLTYVCRMIRPDPSLANSYLASYKQNGLVYHFIGSRHQMDVISAGQTGTQNLKMSAGVRSARNILCKVQDLRAETVTAATADAGQSTFTCDSIAQGIKANLNEWQVESGSHRYPQSRPIDTTSIDNSELLAELEHCFASMGSPLAVHRFKTSEWQEVAVPYKEFEQGDYDGRVDSQRLIISANFSRDLSPFAGLDATLNPIMISPAFDAAYALTDMDGSSNSANSALYFHSFLQYDVSFLLSEDSGSRVYV